MANLKLGKNFELVVQDIVREMDPSATVTCGEWLEGPDGSREIDVLVEGAFFGQRRRIQIECKDYNPKPRPIGIGVIDALESKHRDLGVDVTLLCSNAGFSVEAVRKAKRVGIGLIGALREEDLRIRYKVFDEIYIRRVDVVQNSWAMSFHCQEQGIAVQTPEEFLYQGKPVMEWLLQKATIFLASNLVVSGRHQLGFRFLMPIGLSTARGTTKCEGVEVGFEIKGQWIAQTIEIDASSGLYDWIRQTIALASGPNKVAYKNVQFGTGGISVRCPPGFDPDLLKKASAGQIGLAILDLGGLREPREHSSLDHAVVPADLEPMRRDISEKAYLSSGF